MFCTDLQTGHESRGKIGIVCTARVTKLPFVLPEHTSDHHWTHSGRIISEENTTQYDLWRPNVGTWVRAQQANQKEGHDPHARDREFEVGTRILAKDVRDSS